MGHGGGVGCVFVSVGWPNSLVHHNKKLEFRVEVECLGCILSCVWVRPGGLNESLGFAAVFRS